MDRRDNGILGPEFFAFGGPQPHGPAAFDDHAVHFGVQPDLAAMILDTIDQGARQLAAAAFGKTDRVIMGHDDHDDHAQPRAHIIGELQNPFGRPFQDKDLEKVTFKQLIHDLQRAAIHQIQQTPPIFVALHHHHKGAHGHGHVEHALHQHRHHPPAPFDELAIGLGILGREPGNFIAGFVQRNERPHIGIVFQNQAHRRVWVDIFQPIFRFQPQFVIQQHRVGLNHPVHHRMFVVQKTRGRAFQSDRTTARKFLFLQHQNLFPRLGEIGSRAQLIVPAAHDDDIVIGHVTLPSLDRIVPNSPPSKRRHIFVPGLTCIARGMKVIYTTNQTRELRDGVQKCKTGGDGA